MNKSSSEMNMNETPKDVPVRLPVGQAIRLRRTRMKMSQTDLAERMEVTQGYMSRVEKAPDVIATPERMRRLADILATDVDDLTVGRVPLSWFGATLQDGFVVRDREEAILICAQLNEINSDSLRNMVHSLRRVDSTIDKWTHTSTDTQIDPQLFRVISVIQNMPSQELYDLVLRIEAKNHGKQDDGGDSDG